MIIKNAICLHEEVRSCNTLLRIRATPSCFWMCISQTHQQMLQHCVFSHHISK